MFRYVALVWQAADPGAWQSAVRISRRFASAASEWQAIVDQPGLRVFVTGAIPGRTEAQVLPSRGGVVLGTLFHRNAEITDPTACRRAVLAPGESESIVKSAGRDLIRAYWGRYVALLQSPDGKSTWILRDPTGLLPCFRTSARGVDIFFSSVLDCLELGLPAFTPNWQYITARLAFGTGQADQTGLNEVQEVYGGQCLQLSPTGESKSFYWHPAEVANSELLEDPTRAARALRATAKACARAWTSCYDSIVLRLSGGLDSSIVLSCLADSTPAPKVAAVTYFLPRGNSDERPWARLAAQRFDCEHIEHARNPAAIRFNELLRMAPSVNPACGGATFLELSEFEGRIARERGAGAIATGYGGDSLFGSMTRPQGATDYVRRHGLDLGLLRVAAALAPKERTSVWTVLGRALRDGLITKECDFLRRDAKRYHQLLTERVFEQTSLESYYPHPWHIGSEREPRGVALLIMLHVIPLDYYDRLRHPNEEGPEPLFPLNSQPLVELCFRIPSYVHNENGRDRGLVRRAFTPDLPEEIVNREWKDHGEGQPEATLMRNLDFARQHLLDGQLVAQGLLDRQKVDASLRGAPGKQTAGGNEVLDCLIVESWLRDWTGRTSSAHADLSDVASR